MSIASTRCAPRSHRDIVEPTELPRVAFQGELGAYGDQAIQQRWHGAATSLPTVSFEQVIAEVAHGTADYGVVPVWNTIVGEVEAGCAAVRLGISAAHGLTVLGTAQVQVQHQLLALPGTLLEDIRVVASHPVAIAQCERFLRSQPQMLPEPVYDTAGAARDLARSGVTDSAAIAGKAAADRYGLSILREDIQDIPDNVTRFLILGRNEDAAGATPRAGKDGVSRW